jgi:hypothetical protein
MRLLIQIVAPYRLDGGCVAVPLAAAGIVVWTRFFEPDAIARILAAMALQPRAPPG